MVRIVKAWWLAALLLAGAAQASAEFKQSDLEKMVTELVAVMPQDPKLVYPVKCSIVKDDQVNAYSSSEEIKGSKKNQAIMVVYTGLVNFLHDDIRLIRAVVAHEISHLSRGHVSGYGYVAKDLNQLFTRQQEYDADKTGAAALQRLGYSKQDMVDMLLQLEALRGRKGSWWNRISADHADPKARAAEVADNPTVLQSLMLFDIGLAFSDSRRWMLAGRFFDEAAQKEPKLEEAYINSGFASLMFYYDLLPFKLRESWLRPDFGALLTEPRLIKTAEDTPTDADRKRYRDAIAKLTTAMEKAPKNVKAKELLALGQILEPDGDKATVQKGADTLKAMNASESDEKTMLRYANNAAVGLDRLGDLDTGYTLLINAQKKTNFFNPALGENLGRIHVKDRPEADEKLALNVMYTWLSRSSSVAPYWDIVKQTYLDSAKKLNMEVKDVTASPMSFVKAVSLRIDGNELGLFRPMTEYQTAFGKPDLTLLFDERYPDLTEVRWKGGNVAVMTELGKIMRVTTYQPDSYVFLQPTEKSVSGGFKVSVGMTEADMKKILNPAAASTKKLIRGSDLEEWMFWPSINMGVVMADGKVKGITVAIVEPDEE